MEKYLDFAWKNGRKHERHTDTHCYWNVWKSLKAKEKSLVKVEITGRIETIKTTAQLKIGLNTSITNVIIIIYSFPSFSHQR